MNASPVFLGVTQAHRISPKSSWLYFCLSHTHTQHSWLHTRTLFKQIHTHAHTLGSLRGSVDDKLAAVISQSLSAGRGKHDEQDGLFQQDKAELRQNWTDSTWAGNFHWCITEGWPAALEQTALVLLHSCLASSDWTVLKCACKKRAGIDGIPKFNLSLFFACHLLSLPPSIHLPSILLSSLMHVHSRHPVLQSRQRQQHSVLLLICWLLERP